MTCGIGELPHAHRSARLRTASVLALTACTLACATGCVERWLFIRSVPSGATLVLDGRERGVTPVRVPFDHYGTREILLRHPGTRDAEGRVTSYRTRVAMLTISAPWYERFPLDLLSENAWPGTIVDEHTITYELDPYDPAAEVPSLLEEARARGVEVGDPDPQGRDGEGGSPR